MATEPCYAVGAPSTTKVPYRVLDEDYLSQQLPQLQERVPKSQKVNVRSEGENVLESDVCSFLNMN